MRVLILTILVALATGLAARSVGSLTRVYAGSDGAAHVVDATGRDTALPKQRGQVAVSEPRLSPDHSAAGWLIEEDNCCTSYPIPLRLGLYRNGRVTILSADWGMIYDWAFEDGGAEVAISTGVVHGRSTAYLELYEVRSGRRVSRWIASPDDRPPSWAAGLRR